MLYAKGHIVRTLVPRGCLRTTYEGKEIVMVRSTLPAGSLGLVTDTIAGRTVTVHNPTDGWQFNCVDTTELECLGIVVAKGFEAFVTISQGEDVSNVFTYRFGLWLAEIYDGTAYRYDMTPGEQLNGE